MFRLLVVLSLASMWSSSAAAQGDMSAIRGTAPPPEPEPPVETWEGHYQRAMDAFGAGDLEVALAGFTRAYELGGPASLAFNMGLTLDRLGRRADALQSYQRYLVLVPEATNRREVEDRIAVLSGSGHSSSERAPLVMTLLDAPAPAGATASEALRYTAPVIDEPSARPGPEWTVSWVFLALTAASGAGTGIAYAAGSAQFEDLRAFCASVNGCTEREIAEDPSHTSATATNVMWVTTGILGAITIASFVIEGLVSANPPRRTFIRGASLDVGPGSLRFRLSF